MQGACGDSAEFIHSANYPFRGCDYKIPNSRVGYVYCLFSTRVRGRVYVGSTLCLNNRLLQHNRGEGAIDTRDPQLLPWALLCYVAPIGVDESFLRACENLLKEKRDALLTIRGSLHPSDYPILMREMLQTKGLHLSIVSFSDGMKV